MKYLHAIILFFGIASPISAFSWDYTYLTLEQLIDQSSLVVVAEVKSIEYENKYIPFSQKVRFTPINILKGDPSKNDFYYYAKQSDYESIPISKYIDAPIGTKYLLFLTQWNGVYLSTLGPCGALRIDDSATQDVMWYTDTSKPQRYSEHWKTKPLKDAVQQIKAKIFISQMRLPLKIVLGLLLLFFIVYRIFKSAAKKPIITPTS
jgi:hypothetical protein